MYDSNSWAGSIFLITDNSGNTMVVDLSFIVPSDTVHVSRHQDVVERLDQVEEQPDVDHLDVGGLWKVVADVDEHCCENQHRRDIQRDHGFEAELLEIVG